MIYDYFGNTILAPYILDPDQAQRFVWPDLVSNCFDTLMGKAISSRQKE